MTPQTKNAPESVAAARGQIDQNTNTHEGIEISMKSFTDTVTPATVTGPSGRTVHPDDILLQSLCNADQHTVTSAEGHTIGPDSLMMDIITGGDTTGWADRSQYIITAVAA